MFRFSLIVLSVFGLVACGKALPRAVYTCADGTKLDVVFEPEQAVVTLADGAVLTLPQQVAASGMWYSSGGHELRGKGNDATWTVGRMVPTACTA